jgi:hypothetical protein
MVLGEDSFTFKVLVFNVEGKSTIQSEANLLYSMLSNGLLWENEPASSEKDLSISSGGIRLHVRLVQHSETTTSNKQAFLVEIAGCFDELERLRPILSEHLRSQRLGPLYILEDSVSERIACVLYPYLYRTENALRSYLVRFMTTRLGPEWWEVTATPELSQKVRARKNNETVFADHIDNKAYLIDFGDLGRMIYSFTSGFTGKDDIIRRISEMQETPDAIRELKADLQSNYQKFFRESFKDRDFQAKWEELEKIRHKVAHSNLFVRVDLDRGIQLADEVLNLINTATNEVEKVILKDEEKTAIQQSIISQGYSPYVITDQDFLSQLKAQEDHFATTGGFVGLAYFVKRCLGEQGFSVACSYGVTSRLQDEGKVEIYDVENPRGDYPTAAIRTVEMTCSTH